MAAPCTGACLTAAPSWAARCGSSKHCFRVSILYALVEFILQRLLHGADTLLPQGLFSGVLLWVGWRCGLAGWNVWGWALRPAATACSTWARCCGARRGGGVPTYRAVVGAAAFVVLLVLGRLGSVGLAGNGYTNPRFCWLASMAGWVLVREAACLTAPLPCVSAALAYLGRATMPIVILHFLSFKLVTWLGLLATGGESYLLAAFPDLFYGRCLVVGLHRRRSGSAAGGRCGVQENKKCRLSALM